LDSVIIKSPYYFDGYLDILKKGKHFSAKYVGKNPKCFKQPDKIKETSVPLYFFEGRNDHVIACAPELVVDYCKTIDAPVAKVIWFENSAHYIPVEEPNKFQNELIKILKERK
jgi:pimeloyl-ACP methyl ester carboxylesterase